MSIQEELIAMNHMFLNVMGGTVHKDWKIIGGEIEISNQGVALEIYMSFAPYADFHTEIYNKKLYTKIIENYLDQIEKSNDEELHSLVNTLNSVVKDNVDISVVEDMSDEFLVGAYDFQYLLWANNTDTEISKLPVKVDVEIMTHCVDSVYFIYEDLALIKVGLDSNISNSPHYGEIPYMGYKIKDDSLDDFELNDDVWDF